MNVDVCPACEGTFVDGIELRRVVGDDALALELSDLRGIAAEPCVCPACSTPMFLDSLDDIQLDHCPHCLGVWLDAGEIDRLAARSRAARARAPKLDAVLRDIALGLREAGK